MKPPPKTESFQRFTEALRQIVQVPKSEVEAAIKAPRYRPRKPKPSASTSGREG